MHKTNKYITGEIITHDREKVDYYPKMGKSVEYNEAFTISDFFGC